MADTITIFFKSGSKKACMAYCNICSKQIGYKLYSKKNAKTNCRSCMHRDQYDPSDKERASMPWMNFDDYMVDSDGKRCYKAKCPHCGKECGFRRRYRWSMSCRACSQTGQQKSLVTRIKVSCSQRKIHISSFNGFITPSSKRERIKFDKLKLAQQCFKMTDYTCVACKVRGGTLNAHHLECWHKNPKLRFDINNLICLCNKCHKNFHAIYSYKNNTTIQINEFLREIHCEI